MDFERPGDAELSLRERKKLQTKRRVQGVALQSLVATAYADLTVEEISAAAGVSPSTVYRHFQTKEGIFLWDEYDDAVLSRFEALLREHDPLVAMTMAVNETLTSQFAADKARSLAQLDVIWENEPLRNELTVRMNELRVALAAMVIERGWSPLEANVFAGSIVSAFTGVVELWAADQGRESLPAMFDDAMRLLADGFDHAGGLSVDCDDDVTSLVP